MRPPLCPVLPLTEGRTQLFRLADDVLSGQVDRVRLTHRSQRDDLLLIRASAVTQLEREVADLRARVAPAVRPLAGLGALLVTDEELLADLAASSREHAAAADARLLTITGGLTYPIHSHLDAQVAEGAAPKVSRARRATQKPKG